MGHPPQPKPLQRAGDWKHHALLTKLPQGADSIQEPLQEHPQQLRALDTVCEQQLDLSKVDETSVPR